MNFFTRFLVKSGILEMNDRVLQKWAKRKKVSSLIYALKYAHYTNRAYAAKLLAQFQNPDSIEALVEALADSMNFVSQAAIRSLESMQVSDEVQAKVKAQKEYWEKVQPEITQMKKKVKGNMAGFHDSNITDPGGYINNDNSGAYGI